MYREREKPTTLELKEALQNVGHNNEEIMLAYLYGSFGEGYATDRSDIDVAVVVDEGKLSSDRFTHESRYSEQIERNIKGWEIDVRIMNPAPLSHTYQVIKDGLLLFSRDEVFRENFECRILSEYFDFKPHWDEYDTQFLKRLAERATG